MNEITYALLIIGGAVGKVIGFIIGIAVGDRIGTRDTEQRWSNAVAAKTVHDAYQSQRWNSVKQGTL